MKIRQALRRNFLIRGLYDFIHQYFPSSRSGYGYVHPTARIDSPLILAGRNNIFLHEHTHIPHNSMIFALNAPFVMKKYSECAHGLIAITGNHVRIPGKFYQTITEVEKPLGHDAPITVEEDVWMGCNVTLLSGVTVGRGATIAAGSIVTKNIPPYSIACGAPAKVLKFYWTIEQIQDHERLLYPENERLTLEELKAFSTKYHANIGIHSST